MEGGIDQPGTYTYTPPTEEEIKAMEAENEYAAQSAAAINQAGQAAYDAAIAQGLSPMQAQEARRTSPEYKAALQNTFELRRLARIGNIPYTVETMTPEYIEKALTTMPSPESAEARMGVPMPPGQINPQFINMVRSTLGRLKK